MKKLSLMALIFAALAVPFLAQENAPDQTAGYYNGRFWAKLGASGKLGWVTGYVDGLSTGLTVAGSKDAPGKTAAAAFPFDMAFGEIVKAVDQFYEAPENARIPLWVALFGVNHKAHGDSPAQMEDWAATQRKQWSQDRSAVPISLPIDPKPN